MAFNVENGSGSTLDIDDLGITLDTGEITDLALRGDPAIIAISAQSGDEISTLITSGDLIVKDPIDGTTNLNVADGLACARSINDPHFNLADSRVRITVEDSSISFSDLEEANRRIWTTGPIDSISVSDGGAGTVDVTTGEALFHTSASETAAMIVASYPASTGLALTDDVTQLVYADYNAGTPTVAVTTDTTLDGTGAVNFLDTVLLAVVERDGTAVTIFPANTINNVGDKILQRLYDAEGLTKTQGAGTLIQDLGLNNIGVTSGSFYFGLIKIPHGAFDTSAADTFTYWRRDGVGGWIEEDPVATDWDDQQYDTDPGLATLSNNRYTNVWIYLQIGNPTSSLHCIYGTSNERDVTTALTEDLPGIGSSLPPPLQRLGIYIGRFVIQRGAVVASLVISAFNDELGGGGGTQNLWETVASDAGSTVADSPTDTLTIAGGTGISTAIAGDTLTITASGSASDELVKVSANDTTAGFLNGKLIATTDETSLTENNDGGNETLSVGIADDPILPGDGSATMPAGTTGERPGSPVAGMMRFNETTSFMEFYDGTTWVNLAGNSSGPGTIQGNIVGYHYLLDKDIYGSWLGTTTKHITSDEVQYIMPFDGEIVSLTYGSNLDLSDLDVYIEFAEFGDGANNTTKYLWQIRGARVAHNSAAGESFTIDFAGITGASLPTGAVAAAAFDVSVPTSAQLFPGVTYRFWFSDGSTTAPAAGITTLVAIPFTGAETAQAISDLVVTAMVTTSGEPDLANADNAGGTTTLVSCVIVSSGNVTDIQDGASGTQVVDVGGTRVDGDSTGLANDATVYTATIAVDGGGAQPIAIFGASAQTYGELLRQLNADTDGAVWVLAGGNVAVGSSSGGPASTVSIVDTDVFSTLSTFVAVNAAVAGSPITGAAFTVVSNGGPFGLLVTKGGKLGVYAEDPDTAGVEPDEVVLSVFVQWTNEPQIEGVESYDEDFDVPAITF